VKPARLQLVRVIAGLLCAVGVLAVAVLAVDPLPGETAVMRAVRADPDAGRGRWQGLSDATDLLPVVLLCGAAAFVLSITGRRGAALLLVAAPLGAAAANLLVKLLMRRDRPPDMLTDDASLYGFPSGHMAHVTATVVALVSVLLPVLGRPGRAVLIAVGAAGLAVTAAAQLVLARHYPSDLLAGALLGGAWVAVLVVVTRNGKARWRDDGQP
jgi:membrane-associated phospholipid phosphatase